MYIWNAFIRGTVWKLFQEVRLPLRHKIDTVLTFDVAAADEQLVHMLSYNRGKNVAAIAVVTPCIVQVSGNYQRNYTCRRPRSLQLKTRKR
jgi:hypothetical protein